MKYLPVYFLLFALSAYTQTYVSFKAEIISPNSDSLIIQSKSFNRVIHGTKGIFSDSLSVTPGMYQLFDGKQYTSLYLKNGFDLKMTVNAFKFDETLKFTGKGADENNYLAMFVLKMGEVRSLVYDGPKKGEVPDISEIFADLENRLNNTGMESQFVNSVKPVLNAARNQFVMMMLDAAKTKSTEGKAAPAFSYDNFKGGKTTLEDFKGKYVYIDVWATWCVPCRQQIPFLKNIENEYGYKNIAFVSVSIDKIADRPKWEKLVENQNLGGTQLLADNEWDSAWVKAFNIQGIPRFILIGPDGKVIKADAPRPSDPALKELLDTLLKS